MTTNVETDRAEWTAERWARLIESRLNYDSHNGHAPTMADWEASLADTETALALFPSSARFTSLLAYCCYCLANEYTQRGRDAEAINLYQRARAAGDGEGWHSLVMSNLYQTLGRLERYVEAAAVCDAVLAASPDDSAALRQRALCLHAAGLFDRAMTDYDFYVERFPKDEQIRVERQLLADELLRSRR